MSLAVRNVLVVDDDERILAMYKRCFDGSGSSLRVETSAPLIAGRGQPMDAAVLILHIGHRRRSR